MGKEEFGAIETQQTLAARAAAATGAEPFVATLVVNDPEVIAAAGEYPEGPRRTEFLATALRIGVLALRSARGNLDSETLRLENDLLVNQLYDRLNAWRGKFEERVNGALTRYFDPKEGMFVERVDRLVKSDGEIAGLMRTQVKDAETHLTRLFEQFIGENSQLIKVLDPSGDNQLVANLRTTLEGTVAAQNQSILAQFSLDKKDSALSRFLSEVQARHGDLHEALRKNLKEVVEEFSLDRDDSAMSRMFRRLEEAQAGVTRELSLDEEGSALRRLQDLLDRNQKQTVQMVNDLSQELKTAISAFNARREEAARSTRHGLQFEQDVGEHLRTLCEPAGDVVEDLGSKVGVIPNCKVGDFVVTLGPDRVAAGGRIVLEAKESAAYDLTATLKEADTARRNRGASVCVFVHSEKTAPASIPTFQRYGSDLVVRWNADDPAGDVWLKAAVMVAVALAAKARQHDKQEAASFAVIDRAIESVRKQVGGLEDLKTFADTSKSSAEKSLQKIATMQDALVREIGKIVNEVEKLKDQSDQET